MSKSIAIITARGGSKRIPKKNIKMFCGKPILAYSIEVALKSGVFDEVMVSTDDDEIKKIALEYGASVPFSRSEQNSDDFASTVDVLVEVLQMYEKAGVNFDKCCCLYPTAPFVKAERIREAMNLLIQKDVFSVYPIVQFSFPPQRSFYLENGYVKIKYPEFFSCRSQDLEPMYHDCGQYYCFDVKKFLERRTLIGEDTLPIITPEIEVQDIDTLSDWRMAEMKFKLICGGDCE